MRWHFVLVGTLAAAAALCGCGAGDGREVQSLPPSAPAESLDQLLGDACRQGQHAACDLHVLLTLWLEDGPDLQARLRRLLAAQCEAGAPESCVDLARMQRDGRGGRADEAAALDSLFTARRLLREDCLYGLETACARARLSMGEWQAFSIGPRMTWESLLVLLERRRLVIHTSWWTIPPPMSAGERVAERWVTDKRSWPCQPFETAGPVAIRNPTTLLMNPPPRTEFDDDLWDCYHYRVTESYSMLGRGIS